MLARIALKAKKIALLDYVKHIACKNVGVNSFSGSSKCRMSFLIGFRSSMANGTLEPCEWRYAVCRCSSCGGADPDEARSGRLVSAPPVSNISLVFAGSLQYLWSAEKLC